MSVRFSDFAYFIEGHFLHCKNERGKIEEIMAQIFDVLQEILFIVMTDHLLKLICL